jgi:hypothetical protein
MTISNKIIKVIESKIGSDKNTDEILLEIKEKIEKEIVKDEIEFINRLYTIGYFDKEMSRKFKTNYYESELKPIKMTTST